MHNGFVVSQLRGNKIHVPYAKIIVGQQVIC